MQIYTCIYEDTVRISTNGLKAASFRMGTEIVLLLTSPSAHVSKPYVPVKCTPSCAVRPIVR